MNSIWEGVGVVMGWIIFAIAIVMLVVLAIIILGFYQGGRMILRPAPAFADYL